MVRWVSLCQGNKSWNGLMGAMKSFSHPQIPIIHSADLLQHTISFYIEASIDYALLNSQEFLMTTFFTLPKVSSSSSSITSLWWNCYKSKNTIHTYVFWSNVLCTSVQMREKGSLTFFKSFLKHLIQSVWTDRYFMINFAKKVLSSLH